MFLIKETNQKLLNLTDEISKQKLSEAELKLQLEEKIRSKTDPSEIGINQFIEEGGDNRERISLHIDSSELGSPSCVI